MGTTAEPFGDDDPGGEGDAELIDRARSGDAAAYGLLWKRYLPLAYGTVRRIASSRRPLDADEIVAESFLQILRALRAGKGPTSSFGGYLTTTIRNLAMRAVTAEDTASIDLDLLEDPSLSDDPIARVFENETVVEAIRGLPQRWQEVLWLSEVERLPQAEIARRLGMTPNSVAQLAYRARNGLRDAWLQAQLGQSEPGSAECERVLQSLPAYARSRLGSARSRQIEQHIASCESCARACDGATDIVSRMHAALPLFVLAGAGAGGGALWQVAQAAPASALSTTGPHAAMFGAQKAALLGLAALLAALGTILAIHGHEPASAQVAGYVAPAIVPETVATASAEEERRTRHEDVSDAADEGSTLKASALDDASRDGALSLVSAELLAPAPGSAIDPTTVIDLAWTLRIPAAAARSGTRLDFSLPSHLSGSADTVVATAPDGTAVGTLTGTGGTYSLLLSEAAGSAAPVGEDLTVRVGLHLTPVISAWPSGASRTAEVALGEQRRSGGALTLRYAPELLFTESSRVFQQRSSPQNDLGYWYTSPVFTAVDVGAQQTTTFALDPASAARATFNCEAIRGAGGQPGAVYRYGADTTRTSAYRVSDPSDPLGMTVIECGASAVTLAYTPREPNRGFSLELVAHDARTPAQRGDAVLLTPEARDRRYSGEIAVTTTRRTAGGAETRTGSRATFAWPD